MAPSTDAHTVGQVQLGSFEGTYTSSLFGQGTWVCQDDDFVQGSYDEVGIFHCLIGDDGVCEGEFFDAGSGACPLRLPLPLDAARWAGKIDRSARSLWPLNSCGRV